MNLCLTIDTSLYGTALALSDLSGSTLFWKGFYDEKGRSDTAIGLLLEEGLKKVGQPVGTISHLVVSHGPGSFTGIKVGLAWAYGFCLGQKGCKILGLSSLREAVFELAGEQNTQKLTLLFPISRREAFLASLENGEIGIRSVDTEEMVEQFSKETPFFVCQDEKWVALLKERRVVRKTVSFPQLMKLALNGMISRTKILGTPAFGYTLPEPVYMKKSSVEEQRAKKEGGNGEKR
ncbi:MAG: hypothetical protein HYW48_07720 [Deltaproteobacteria bacterium]|nr:hypothetical protein [Deltaproteobacteria bacterium]